MKLFKYGLPLAALAVLASCSNDNIDAPVGGQTPEVGDGSMYMTVNISLPNGAGSRADDDSFQGYDEGLESEYAVKKVQLYLFKATVNETDPEENATFYDRITLGFSDLDTDEGGSDVTGTFKATFQIKGIELNDDKKLVENGTVYDLYGLLVVNGEDANFPDLVEGSTKFNAWNKEVMKGLESGNVGQDYTKFMINNNGFVMTNAPKYSDSKATVLEFVDTETFAQSPQQAEANNPAATFFVQRGVAKVYLTTNDPNFKNMDVYVNDEDKKANDYVQVDNWALDVTNQLTFPVQNVVLTSSGTGKAYEAWSSKNYFFAKDNGQDLEDHIWWAVDPNYYNETSESDNFKFTTMVSTQNHDWTNALTPDYNVSKPQEGTYAYCLENTMDASQQIQNQTTRVVFKCKYKVNNVNWDNEDNAGFIVFNDVAVVVKKDDLLDSENVPAAGTIELDKLINEDEVGNYKSNLVMGSASDEVTWYPGGVTYYVSYIRHFNDNEAKLPSSVDTSSKDFNANSLSSWGVDQLGRYGVLRNNVYAMNVVGFFGYGSPTVPDPDPDTPDDKTPEKQYNAIVTVNVLNWAKRVHDYIPR